MKYVSEYYSSRNLGFIFDENLTFSNVVNRSLFHSKLKTYLLVNRFRHKSLTTDNVN